MSIPSNSLAGAATQTALTYTSAELRILVVESEAALLLLMGEILRAAGHFTGLAGNSLDGLARFRAEPWHVVCTNRNRAGLNGDEFAREIKLLSPATPVILMTRNPPASVGTCVDAVLLKPFTCAALGAVISHCLGLYPQRRDYALSNGHSHEG